jgi:flagellar basal-body rod protein FlgG
MIKGLYTAATGMTAQQYNIDVISNNIANVNTTAFKKDRPEFQDLMYQTLNYTSNSTSANTNNPTGIDVGCGVVISGIQKEFTQGNSIVSGGPLDVAIQGNGFLKVDLPNGEIGYTRNGSLKVNAEGALVNAQGYPINPAITIPANMGKVSIAGDGTVSGVDDTGATVQLGQLTLANFINPSGLSPQGDNLYLATDVSGNAIDGAPGANGMGTLRQGMLESSNVQLVTEMVNLITAQRGYEASSKSITTTDTMLQTVNQLKR